jgi:hypothetical protein
MKTGLSNSKPENHYGVEKYLNYEFFISQIQQEYLKRFADNEKENVKM